MDSEDNLRESILIFQDTWCLVGGVKLRFSALVSAYNYETSVLEDSMSPRHSLANTQTHVTKISKKKRGGRSSSHPQVHRLSETQEAEMNASFVHVTGAGGEE